MINLRLVLLLFVIAATVLNALPSKGSKYDLYVGQYFHLDFPTNAVKIPQLPKWTVFSNSSVFQGIPTELDIGTHSVEIQPKSGKPYIVDLVVSEETESVCGAKETHWIEAVFEKENTVMNRIEAALGLDEEKEPSLRVYSFGYSRKIRKVEDFMSEKPEGNFVAIWKVSCDDFDEATTRLDAFVEREDVEYDTVVMTKGFFVKSKLDHSSFSDLTQEDDEEFEEDIDSLQTTTEVITRTTRKSVDNVPVVLNTLKSFTCTRGQLCVLEVPTETFKDVEDGDTFKLTLTVKSTNNAEVWMSIDPSKGMVGVPMTTGEFFYRLEAQDKSGQVATTPFSVIVKPSLAVNHRVELELEKPRPDVMASDPLKRKMLLNSMSRALHTSQSAITLQEIGVKNNKTFIVWSNNSLPYNMCDETGISAMEDKMILKHKMRTKFEFVKSMGNQFYVKQARVVRTGNCEQEVDLVTTAPTIQSVQEADSQLILISGVLIILLLVAIAVILYCACFKKNATKKSTSTEYVGKGLPVVFPDEVDDHDHTTAGTPMLAREERPPFKVSQHENPLYKPPPPMISTNSPRLGHASASSNQKLPPPFIPP